MGEWRRPEKETSGGTLAAWVPEYQQVVAEELQDTAVVSSSTWQEPGASDYERRLEEYDRTNAVPTKALLQSRYRVRELRGLGTEDDPIAQGPTARHHGVDFVCQWELAQTLWRLEEPEESLKIFRKHHVNIPAFSSSQ